MRKLILVVCFVCSAVNIAACAPGQEEGPLVYLKAQSVNVSSFDTTPDWAPPQQPQAITDGSLLSRWSSDYQDEQWVCLDFGLPKVLSKIAVFWEAAYASDYDVLVSEDAQSWKEVLSLQNQDGEIDQLEFTPVKARFVKLLARKRINPQWGVSLWELLCFGPASDNPEDKDLALVYPQLANQLSGKEADQTPLEIEMPQPSPGTLTRDEFQKGVVYTSWSRGELGTEASDHTLKYLRDLGITHIGIMVVWYQESIEETVITPDAKDTPEDAALAHAINQAHALGMKVMLKPHVDVKSGQWRGDIIPNEEWFVSYKNYIMHYGQLAAQYNVELFSIGTELVNITLPKWQGRWEELIAELRAVFSGSLVYSANWDEYQTVDFWDKLDFVGIDAYFSLTDKTDPTKEELIAGWQRNAQDIGNWLKEKQLNQPVLFNEVGYCSADGTNMHPWAVLTNLSEGCIDQEEQAACLEAMLAVCAEYPWFKGFYWWNYFPQERWSPLGYTIRGKGAEGVLANWLKKSK